MFVEAVNRRVRVVQLLDSLQPCGADTGVVTWPLKCQACSTPGLVLRENEIKMARAV